MKSSKSPSLSPPAGWEYEGGDPVLSRKITERKKVRAPAAMKAARKKLLRCNFTYVSRRAG